MTHYLDVILATHRELARSAIATVCGATAVEMLAPVSGGVSGALVYQFTASGRRYVLRMEGPASPLRNPHQYTSLQIAAEAGIAPRIHYLDESTRVVVMDFVEDRPLEEYPGGLNGLARGVGKLVQQVHELPLFPRYVHYPDIVTRLWAHVCRTGLFTDGVLDACSERLSQLQTAYEASAYQAVSSHNDFLPRNLLFDGKRLWLIDWESAYRNHPFVDVATALDNFAATPEREEWLLQAYLGRAPDTAFRDRLAQAAAFARLYYAGVLFSASAAAKRDKPDDDVAALSASEFEHAIRAGSLKPETPPTSHALGKMYLASFMSGAKPPGLPPLYMR